MPVSPASPCSRRFRQAALFALLPGSLLAAPVAQLEEVVVTARRQAVPTLATPLSIGRVGDAEIDLVGATHSSELLNRVPGALVQRGSGQESLTAIRSPVLTGAGSCGAFLFLENGVPVRPVGFCNVNGMLEINTEQADAIEVLRGTGTALYGSNAVHGTVNVLQAEPAARPGVALDLGAGEDDYERVGVAAARGGEGLDAGVKAFYAHDGGWRDASGYDEAKVNATLVAGEEAATASRFDLAATWLDQETAGFILGRNAYRDDDLITTNPNPEAYRDAHAVRLTGLLRPEVPLPGRLELRPYARTSRMEFLQHFLLGQPVERNGQDSLGLMSTYDWELPGRASLVTGIDLEWADSSLLEKQDAPTTDGTPAANEIRPAGRHYDYTVTSQVVAAYGQFEYALTPTLHVGAGLRLEYVGYDYDNRMIAGNTDEDGVPCTPTGCLYSRPADREDSFENAAPKLSLRWDAREGLMLYANASRGFRPPEMTEMYRLQRTQSAAELDSEQIDALELGLKAALGQWNVELAAFDMGKDNVILRDSNGFYVSDGRTSHEGFEYDVYWQPLDWLTARLGGTYARHRYEFSRVIEGGESITRGNDVDTAPRELLRAALGFRPRDTLAAEAEWLVVGDYYIDASNQHRYSGHEVLNLRAAWDFAPRWTATLRLNNALDRRYADRADYAFGDYRYFPGRPRSVFVEIGWKTSD
ncbi:MAG TPA: TonB-dependent receptor [Steroidobacteraceae bacterium]|nr:TonB-dependent receptor [Steroidobacteraceae bacterium]